MALTAEQWNSFQAKLPVEDRMSYSEYVATLSPEEQRQVYLASLTPAQRRKVLEAEGTPAATVVDERTKMAGAKADTAAQKTATATASQQAAAQAAVTALTSGRTLTDAQKAILDIPVTPASTTFTPAQLQAIVAKLGQGKELTPEEAAAINAQVSGTPTGQVTGTPLVTPDGGPGKQPGTAWVLSADGKTWVIPPKPTDGKTYTWDDNKGWVAGNVTKDPGKQPGAAWILNADKSAWVKPPQPNPTDTWDDEKGWIPAKGTGDGPGKQPGKAWVLSADGKSWVKPPMPTDGKTYTWNDETGWVAGVAGDGTPVRPVGIPAAFVWDPVTKTWKMPPKPTEEGNWVFDPNNGWVKSNVKLGSDGFSATEERTLAINTFKNTLGLFFGAAEMDKPWVSGLYKYVSGFYKTGSSMEESFNLALQEGRFDPNLAEFTKRFKGIYALTDLKAKGGVVTVPTIAEYFATESTMGEVLRTAGLGKLANEDFLGDIIGKNVSVTEFTNRITKVYDRIDSAPAELKNTFARFFPSIDRVTLATALLTGEKGAAELAKEVATYEIVSASEQQGLGAIDPVTGKRIGIGLAEAGNIAAQGYGYQAALTGFGQISQNLQPYEKLMEISSGKDVSTDDARKQLQDITFGKLASAQRKADQLAAEEEARFRGSSGLARGGLTSQKYGLV